jgi:hypothetical protein
MRSEVRFDFLDLLRLNPRGGTAGTFRGVAGLTLRRLCRSRLGLSWLISGILGLGLTRRLFSSFFLRLAGLICGFFRLLSRLAFGFRRLLSSLAGCPIWLLSRLALISLAGSHALIAGSGLLRLWRGTLRAGCASFRWTTCRWTRRGRIIFVGTSLR